MKKNDFLAYIAPAIKQEKLLLSIAHHREGVSAYRVGWFVHGFQDAEAINEFLKLLEIVAFITFEPNKEKGVFSSWCFFEKYAGNGQNASAIIAARNGIPLHLDETTNTTPLFGCQVVEISPIKYDVITGELTKCFELGVFIEDSDCFQWDQPKPEVLKGSAAVQSLKGF